LHGITAAVHSGNKQDVRQIEIAVRGCVGVSIGVRVDGVSRVTAFRKPLGKGPHVVVMAFLSVSRRQENPFLSSISLALRKYHRKNSSLLPVAVNDFEAVVAFAAEQIVSEDNLVRFDGWEYFGDGEV
jgi:hypothetical protein